MLDVCGMNSGDKGWAITIKIFYKTKCLYKLCYKKVLQKKILNKTRKKNGHTYACVKEVLRV